MRCSPEAMSSPVLDAALAAGDLGDSDDNEAVPPATDAPEAALGHKTISFFGGLALLSNNVTGPGIAALPLVFVTAGWFPALLLLGVLSLTAGAAALLLCDAICALPGNANYGRRVELLSAVEELLPRGAYVTAFATFVISFQMANIGSIIESAKTADGLLLELLGGTCALELLPRPGARCITRAQSAASAHDAPFSEAWLVVSLGYVLVALVTIPLGYYNLDDSIWVQKVCFLLLGGIVAVWLASFGATGLESHVPVAGARAGSLIGTLLFNFCFVATVPSWVNEKRPGVSVPRSLWSAVAIGTFVFASVGLLGAAAYGGAPDGFTASRDLLTVLLARGGLVARAAAFAFPPVALMSGIPVLSICVRYNLLEQRLCSRGIANVVAVVAPWACALLLGRGGALGAAIDWVSLFAAVPLNFALPAWLYLAATRRAGYPLAVGALDPDQLHAPLLAATRGEGSSLGGSEEAAPRMPRYSQGRAWGMLAAQESEALTQAPPDDDDSWYFEPDDGAGGALHGGGGFHGRVPTLSWRPAASGWAASMWRELQRGQWLDSEVGRKRAAARLVLFVSISLNLAAFAVKIADAAHR